MLARVTEHLTSGSKQAVLEFKEQHIVRSAKDSLPLSCRQDAATRHTQLYSQTVINKTTVQYGQDLLK